MPDKTRIGVPGPEERTVRLEDGTVLPVPDVWELLPPGDATLTRRVKSSGPTWTMQKRKGRKLFSLGVWACKARIAAIRAELQIERSSESYAKRRSADLARRERKQSEYVKEFRQAVFMFLDFAPRYQALAEQLASAVAEHATPVGSGTVARTQRISVERRAESAVIAWLRHQTTAYDDIPVPRVKGKRRELRRMLAEESRRLLEGYRDGRAADPKSCPLQIALKQIRPTKETT